ncbi:TonB-dependent receptor family protein [Halorhodospira halophila]|uniref:TonB-dependent receptor n=1 Tax=Halorhodospira halophila (strain DSM 244 / SL1) TaxID=349124 RepID=A1WUD3_HALHL|nr:TonB-dependent receptor [Halorhodospira halophila]ABM61295.1 TonB-dependent receptor [Halorhodospira halophila SL1]MBK1729123.1 TonB-dependent receptor [Halorhodospira halophila]
MNQTVKPWGVAAAAVMAGGTLGAAQADADDGSSRLLDRIMITGGPDRVQDTAGSAQVLSREDIDRQGYSDPHRILRQIPGVNVAEEEGYGQFPHISMRGVNPERNGRITVMEDGVLTASPAPYAAPAAYYFPPMGRMDNVEVRKGSSAIKHGPYTVGGALNMTSTPIPQETSGKVEGRLGSDNGRRTHAHIGGREGQFGWLLESYTEQSDGFKELDHPLSGDQSNKPNNPVPNTGFDRNNFVAKGLWASDPTAEVYQELEFKYARDRRTIYDTYLGLLPGDFDDNPHRRYAGSQLDEINTENDLYQVRHYIQPTVDTDVTTTVYRTDTVRNWYKLHEVDGDGTGDFTGISDILRDPGDHEDELAWILGGFDTAYDGDLSIDDDARGNVRANNREYYAQGIQVQVGHLFEAFGWDHDMEVGFRYHEDEEDREQWQDSFEMTDDGYMVLDEQENPGETTNRVTSAEAYAFHVQNTMERGSWTLVPGVRYEHIDMERKQWADLGRANLDADGSYSNTYRVWVPGIGATYAIDDQWSVLGGVHRGFAPSGANPDADEERSVNYEAGFRFNDQYTQAEVIGFFNDYSNINYECTNVGGACETEDDLVSAGEVHIWGLEALWLHDLGESQGLDVQLPVRIGYTWTDSEFRQDIDDGPNQLANAREGDRLPEIPEHQLNLSAGVGQADWRVNLNANYVSETRALADRDYSDLKMDARWLFDLSAHYQLKDNVRLLGSIENLTDETYVAHHRPAGARPGAPRTYWAGMRVDF